MKSGHLSRYDGHLGRKTRLGMTVRTLLKVRREAKRPLLVGTVILVLLSIFTNSQASSPFEAMNSAHLSMSQKDVRHCYIGIPINFHEESGIVTF